MNALIIVYLMQDGEQTTRRVFFEEECFDAAMMWSRDVIRKQAYTTKVVSAVLTNSPAAGGTVKAFQPREWA